MIRIHGIWCRGQQAAIENTATNDIDESKIVTTSLDSDLSPLESTFIIGHAVVSDEFDGSLAQSLTYQLDFAVGNKFGSSPPAQPVRVYRPLCSSFFERIQFDRGDSRWLDIEDEIGVEEPGFTGVLVKIRLSFLKVGSQTCEVDVQYLDQSIGTLTVSIVSENSLSQKVPSI